MLYYIVKTKWSSLELGALVLVTMIIYFLELDALLLFTIVYFGELGAILHRHD